MLPFPAFCYLMNPIALRKAKIVYNFVLSKCNRVKEHSGMQIYVKLCIDLQMLQTLFCLIPLFHPSPL